MIDTTVAYLSEDYSHTGRMTVRDLIGEIRQARELGGMSARSTLARADGSGLWRFTAYAEGDASPTNMEMRGVGVGPDIGDLYLWLSSGRHNLEASIYETLRWVGGLPVRGALITQVAFL